MRILVTGASGNVGSHVVPELVRRGHMVRAFAGDVTDPAAVNRAVDGVDAVVHLAAVIPPASDADPERAREVNVDGTANVVAACLARPSPPRLLFTSTFDVHGHTLDRTPPRRVDDPLVATDPYTTHKIECERLIRGSGLTWAIFRLADVPVLGIRDPHPIMFEIGLHNRIEALHADDAGLAIANALETPEVWGRVLFIGGGPSCQLTYRDYLTRILTAMGIKPLPDKAFSDAVYATDWVDTAESQALLGYQRHTFDDITAAIAAGLGWRRRLVPLVGPLARLAMLRLSPYYWRR
ncbi:MAG TPA: NAD(P)-dependent oxidoreductase [Actinophytocola sp.]|uniref:NAD-dependent epimerase/dehydratase family protein n=1 Tax=Actinophytocola sp. TaxID=1872138 RepID=UPI002DDD265D|nr:NAD(P)-dependent oxidoreductase [Actinophytocola sp.]HEV2779422.1 NAD(P)-dependent oxidoreductase [Actinophytocola sp.]